MNFNNLLRAVRCFLCVRVHIKDDESRAPGEFESVELIWCMQTHAELSGVLRWQQQQEEEASGYYH